MTSGVATCHSGVVAIFVGVQGGRIIITEEPFSESLTQGCVLNQHMIPGMASFNSMSVTAVLEETVTISQHLRIVVDCVSEALAIFHYFRPLLRSALEGLFTALPTRNSGTVTSSVRNAMKWFTESNAEDTNRIIRAVNDEERHVHKLHGVLCKEALPGFVVLGISFNALLVDCAGAIVTVESPAEGIPEKYVANNVGTIKENSTERSGLKVNRIGKKTLDLIGVIVCCHTTSRITNKKHVSSLIKIVLLQKILDGFNKDTVTTIIECMITHLDRISLVTRERRTVAVDEECMIPIEEIGVELWIFTDWTTICESISPKSTGSHIMSNTQEAFFIT